ncbi:MAG: hypothetical protein E7471_03590 [Ruminococcaceae bacterium]|nr:hypothetical protein [Oscillospiraceae bacterium]
MLEKLKQFNFSDINLDDCFFDSLKADYGPQFIEWYTRKATEGAKALAVVDNRGVHAFLYMKRENEEIATKDIVLPKAERVKIGTLKLDSTVEGQRLGEGVIGVALWKWQLSKIREVYLTVFPKQITLISMLEKFGFKQVGIKENGELILMKSRDNIDFSSPYKSFPFIYKKANRFGLIPIKDIFHDKLFTYSESFYKLSDFKEAIAGNGITKVYIGCPYTCTQYSEGQVVGIYRIYTGNGSKGNRSAITSFCTITKITIVKSDNKENMSFDEYMKMAGNKTIFESSELRSIYKSRNVIMIEMVYNTFLPKGKNITYWQLKNNQLFEDHPYNIEYTAEQMKSIMKMGGVDIENIIID